MINVFVYGTLKPGEVNYSVCAEQVVQTQPAISKGSLYHLPFGYPAMALGGHRTVRGVILTFLTSDILTRLDDFEQHDPEKFRHHAPNLSLSDYQYSRQQIPTFSPAQNPITLAWSYVMTLQQIQALGGISIPSGQWPS